MRQLGAIVLSFAVLAGASALAVGPLHDRELFVSPPDAVAEGFVREVVTARYDQARSYLAEPSSRSEDDLRALDARLGEVSEVEAELVSGDEEQALVNVIVSGAESSHAVTFTLAFDREWKIE